MSTTTPAVRTRTSAPRLSGAWQEIHRRFLHLENVIHYQLIRHSVAALRIALGLIFLGFGVLKYFPGVSPAQGLVEATTHILFLHLIPGDVAIKLIATLECVIGVCLLANRWMRLAIWLLAFEFIGILSPIVLLSGQLFSGPHHAPTLAGQYCLKDIILVAAGLVVAAGTFRGGRMVRTDLPPSVHIADAPVTDPRQKLAIVLGAIHDPEPARVAAERHHISEAEFHQWRETVLAGATRALADRGAAGPDQPASFAAQFAPVPAVITATAATRTLSGRPTPTDRHLPVRSLVAALVAVALLSRN